MGMGCKQPDTDTGGYFMNMPKCKILIYMLFILLMLVYPVDAYTERPKSNASDQVALLNTTWFDTLMDSMDGSSPDFTRFISALLLPYTSRMGGIFYVFIYILPLVIIWLRQEKVLIPSGLLGIFGLILIPMLPAEWRLLAGLCVILTSFGVVYSLFKERG